jgi:uncharacterized protein (DUF952 family)
MVTAWRSLTNESKPIDNGQILTLGNTRMTIALTRRDGSGHHAPMLIFKIFRAGEWAELQRAGETAGAPVDISDGFVHFSTGPQAAETCAKWFAGAEGLVLLALEAGDLGEALKWEPSRGGALFPHLYRALQMQDVLWCKPLPLGPEGHEFPEGVL